MEEPLKPKTNLPLKNVRILVGRARRQASALSKELRKLGAEVLEIPFIEIRKPSSFQPLDSALKNLASYDWLILTSVNGVEAMWDRMKRLRFTKAPYFAAKKPRIAAIGPATKAALEERGLKVDIVPKEYVAESVVRSLRKKVKGKRVLLIRAKIARDIIPRELRRAGAQVDVIEAYETVVPKSSQARLRATLRNPKLRPHVVTFTSSSTVKNFVALLGSRKGAVKSPAVRGRERPLPTNPLANLEGIRFASIGPITSSTLREFGLPIHTEAEEFTIPGLVRAVVRLENHK